ncbi:MAG TPA: hypothetical protein VET83_02710 [Candidatus Dormibacteraeota bacterium]|nr:hypothetical protein [Candidatus Dormibacteraeota bacterium]
MAGMIYGGGDLRGLITHNMRRSRGWVMSQLALDELIPRKNAEALYRKAQSPKKIIWLDSNHITAKNRELTRHITSVIRDELVATQLLNATHMA